VTTTPARNEPCPCGSGKKYKHCCAARDARAAPALRLLGARTASDVLHAAAAAARRAVPWEADVTATGALLLDEPAARPAAVILAMRDHVLNADFVSHPPSDGAGVAALLAAAVDDVIARGAVPPSRVRVRYEEVASHLAPLLSARGIKVERAASLPTLEGFAAKLRQDMNGLDAPVPAVSIPESWAAWTLPEQTVAELFAAAAEFHAAQPWLLLENDQLLELITAGARSWIASVMGNGGQEFGLVLHESMADVMCMFATDSPDEAFLAMRSAVLSLNFSERGGLPKPMQREIARAGWKVNGPSAYPILFTINTIGGGISPTQAQDLTHALGATARFAAAHARLLGDPARAREIVVWLDEPTGMIVRLDDRDAGAASLWPPVTLLSSCRAEGEHADPRALFSVEHDDGGVVRDASIIARFIRAERDAGASAARVERDVDNVELFVDAMHGYQGVCLPAVTEYDLRVFLYDWLPRKVMTSRTGADTVRGSLRRFSEYLAAHEGIAYPWAHGILRDKLAFETRWDDFPGGYWWDEGVAEWMGELSADLYERAMLPADALAGIGEWGETMGLEEARLFAALQREWLVWRDEVIAAGQRSPPAVRAELARRQADWERQPQSRLGGRTVSDVVRRERAERRELPGDRE
jgi:SEC-C motif